MITHIGLKSQPKKKLSYPDCYPFFSSEKTLYIWDIKKKDEIAQYSIEVISRLEFRP